MAFLAGDTADPSHADALVARAQERFGGLDVVVNNAGMQIEKTIADTSIEEWDRIFDVNVKGVFLLCRAALPALAMGTTLDQLHPVRTPTDLATALTVTAVLHLVSAVAWWTLAARRGL